jgi:hypothetical protein
MHTTCISPTRKSCNKVTHSVFNFRTTLLALAISLVSAPALAGGRDHDDDDDDRHPHKKAFCSMTAKAANKACGYEVKDDYWIAVGNCINEADADERHECFRDAREERRESNELCKAQLNARRELCDAVGEARYDPDFDPENFVNPAEIGTSVAPNAYFPLVAGNQWVYEGGDERITVTVTEDTKLIEGVTCVVVNDLVEEDGVPVENTDDWYAQDHEGNVWYCGEIVENFEVFAGDDPEDPELVDIDGSWKAGRDDAKPGMLIGSAPQVGDIYQQEVALGDAEDIAEVISTSGNESVAAGFACNNDCVITRDGTPIEPGVYENKHYIPGIGLILEEDMEGNRVELVEFTTP